MSSECHPGHRGKSTYHTTYMIHVPWCGRTCYKYPNWCVLRPSGQSVKVSLWRSRSKFFLCGQNQTWKQLRLLSQWLADPDCSIDRQLVQNRSEASCPVYIIRLSQYLCRMTSSCITTPTFNLYITAKLVFDHHLYILKTSRRSATFLFSANDQP